MKHKKIIMYTGVVLLVLMIIGIGYLVCINIVTEEKEVAEDLTQEDIIEEQLRQTIVTLYFMDLETGRLMPEPRQVEIKELLENPYYYLVKLLIEGPKNEAMDRVIPPETVLNEAKIEGDVVYIDFSEGFIKEQNLGEEKEKLIIQSIVKTLTELIEVNAVRISIDGATNMGFPDEGVVFTSPFTRES